MMKILFLNVDLGYGGAEKMMAWVANQMEMKGMDVTFLTYRDPTANFQKLNKGVHREHIQLESRGGSILGFFESSKKLHKYIMEKGFDVGIAFLSPSQIRLVHACIGTQTRVLLSYRSDPYQKSQLTGLRKLVAKRMNKLFLQADSYVFQTHKAEEYFPDYIQKKSVIIPNPIKLLKRTLYRNPDKRIVCVARLENIQKRQDLLIEAFNKISVKYPEYTLNLFGNGPDEAILKDMARGNERIIFEGVTTNVVDSIQNAAMFVLSSDYEGIPNALLEAMALGIPCISTDCSPGGASLLIDDPSKGIIVECNNADKLAAAMETFILEPEKAEACGRKGMDVNERFAENVIADRWYEIIK